MQSGPRALPEHSRRGRGATFVRSEDQKVQRLQHVHLLYGERSVKHWHRRQVIWKRRPAYPMPQPSGHDPEPIERVCTPVLSRQGRKSASSVGSRTARSPTTVPAQGAGRPSPSHRHSECSTGCAAAGPTDTLLLPSVHPIKSSISEPQCLLGL